MTEDEVKNFLDEEIKNTIEDWESVGDDPKVVESHSVADNMVSAFLLRIDEDKNMIQKFLALGKCLVKLPLHTAEIILREIKLGLAYQLNCVKDRESILRDLRERLDSENIPEAKKHKTFVIPGNPPNPIPVDTIRKIAEYEKYKLSPERYETALLYLKSTANTYYKKLIYHELANFDLPKRLKLMKKTIEDSSIYGVSYRVENFRYEALLEVQKEIEKEIALQKEEVSHRNQLNLSKTVGEEKVRKAQGYPPHLLKQIIDTAVRLYEEKDKVRAIDIYQAIPIEKNTYNNRIKYFGYDTPMILEKAQAIIRERESSKK